MLLINKRHRRGTYYLVLDVMQLFSTSAAVNYLWRFQHLSQEQTGLASLELLLAWSLEQNGFNSASC